jgi:hypothetical protein
MKSIPQVVLDDQSSFAVRNIFESAGNNAKYVKVSVDYNTFNAIKGMSPELPYTTTHDALGKGVRIFDIDGIKVMSQYDKETRKTSFIMDIDDATANLRSLDDERSDEPGLDFAF